MNKLISVIIPSYNSALINETLDSVLKQTYTLWECIIVDDGSNDHMAEIIKKYSLIDNRFQYFFRPEHKPKGPSSCRNYGIEKAKGEYVMFLDSDDLLLEDCIEKRLEFVNCNSDHDFWIFKMYIYDSQSKTDNTIFNSLPLQSEVEELYYLKEFLRGKFPFNVTCPLWKREVLIKLKGFDENLRMLEDPDLHLRAFKNRFSSKTALNFEPDCFYRISNDVQREDKIKQYNLIAAESNFYFLKKHFIQNNADVKYNFNRVFNLYGFKKPSFYYINQMNFLGLQNNIVSMKQLLLSYIILVFGFLRFNRIKGIGYNTLRKEFNK